MLKVAVIGVGHLGKNHAKVFSRLPDIKLVGVVDTNPAQAQEIARLYQTQAFTDYKDLPDEIDAVSIATPTNTHYRIARDTISQGIHTFIEKPITTMLSQADKLVALARPVRVATAEWIKPKQKPIPHITNDSNGVKMQPCSATARKSRPGGIILQVGHIERFNPAFVSAKEYIKNPRFIECHRLSSFSFRSIDIDVILDLMIHDIDIILSIVKSPIKKIDAVGVKVISDKIDLANVRIAFGSGCVANLTASRASDKAMRKMRVFTDKNYVSIDFADKTASVYQRKGTLSSLEQIPSLPLSTTPKDFMLDKFIGVTTLNIHNYDQLEKELSSFVQSIRGNTKPMVSGQDGRDALAVCHRILSKM